MLAFAVERAKSDGSYYKKRGNIEDKVRSDVMNGALGEIAARALLVRTFGAVASVSDVDLTVYAVSNKSYKSDFVVDFNGYLVSVHVKMHVCGRYNTIRPSFLFQKPGVGLHRDRELATIKPNGQSSDLFVGVLGFVEDANKRADGSTPKQAVADKATVIGPFSFQQIVDQNLWHEPDAEGVRRRGKKIALLAQELCEKVPAIQGVVA